MVIFHHGFIVKVVFVSWIYGDGWFCIIDSWWFCVMHLRWWVYLYHGDGRFTWLWFVVMGVCIWLTSLLCVNLWFHAAHSSLGRIARHWKLSASHSQTVRRINTSIHNISTKKIPRFPIEIISLFIILLRFVVLTFPGSEENGTKRVYRDRQRQLQRQSPTGGRCHAKERRVESGWRETTEQM